MAVSSSLSERYYTMANLGGVRFHAHIKRIAMYDHVILNWLKKDIERVGGPVPFMLCLA